VTGPALALSSEVKGMTVSEQRTKELNAALTSTELATGVPIPLSVREWLIKNTLAKEGLDGWRGERRASA
jgi:hypothetical protein